MRYNTLNDYVVEWGEGHYLLTYAYHTQWLSNPRTNLSHISQIMAKGGDIPTPYTPMPRIYKGLPPILAKHGPIYTRLLGYPIDDDIPPDIPEPIQLLLSGTRFLFTMTIHPPIFPFDPQSYEKWITQRTSSAIKVRSDMYRKQRDTPTQLLCSGLLVTGNQISRAAVENALSQIHPIEHATFDSNGSFLSLPAFSAG